MIDPRALQQHFNKVQKQQPQQKQLIPQVTLSEPLTTMQAVAVIVEEPNIVPIKAKLPKIKTEPLKEKIDLIINEPPPIDKIVINETEEKTIEEYDPYGYYTGPKF